MSQSTSPRQQDLERYLQQAIALQKAGQLAQAYNLYQRLVQAAPDLYQAWSNMGHINLQAERPATAEQFFRKALDINAGYEFALNGLGAALFQQNRPHDAAEIFTQALRKKPDDKTILCNLGVLLSGIGRAREAQPVLEKAVRLAPEDYRVLFSLGSVYYHLGSADEAIEKYETSLRHKPDFALTKKLLAKAYACKRDFRAAFTIYEELEKQPDICADYGWALTRAGDFARAEAILKEGLKINPEYVSCLNNLGSLYRDTGRMAEALEIYERALDIDPTQPEAGYNYGITLIKVGQADKGWHYHEWRWHTDSQNALPPELPCWDGQTDLNEKTLLIITDQGIGDVINFVRYVPLIKRQYPEARIVLEVEQKLVSLLRHNYDGICDVRTKEDRAHADLWTSFLALPAYFINASIHEPYLKASKPKSYKDNERQLVVGLSWHSTNADSGTTRSLQLKDFAPLAKNRNVKFIDLQYGDTSSARQEARKEGLEVLHDDNIDAFKDIGPFVDQVAACDLVISIDNTTVHVAGAIGVPVWTILPDTALFRWGENGQETHWYQSMRLFRPQQGQSIHSALQESFSVFDKFYAGEKERTAPPPPFISNEKKGKTCILLNDTSAWYHWGCTATSEALQHGIESKGYQFNRIRHQAISKTLIPPPSLEDFHDPNYFMRWRFQNPSLIWEMEQAGTVMINGEGTIHRTADNALKLLYLAYAAKHHMNKCVHIVNHACFPEGGVGLGDAAIQALYKKAYGAADYVAVRDPVSHDILNQMGIRNTLAFDSLPLTVRDHYTASPRETRVVIAGSSAFSTQSTIALQQLLVWLKTQNMAAEILLGAQRDPAADDRAFTETLAMVAPGQYKIHEAKSMKEWLDRIATASLLVSGRFHYTIAAACLGTPFVALEGNTPKMAALTKTLESEPPLSYTDPKLHIHLIAQCSAALKKGPVSTTEKNGLLQRLCEMAEKNFEKL